MLPDRLMRAPGGNLIAVSYWIATVCLLTVPFPCICAAEDSATTGTLRGKVIYQSDPKRPWRLGRYYIRNSRSGELAEAVVAISRSRMKAPEETHEPVSVTVDQKNFQFVPETVAIRVGDRIRFLNSDDHVHNVRTNHPRKAFNINMPAGVEHVETFDAASGIRQPFQIECVFHSAMRSWVYVFDHPWFAVTGADGAFTLEHVPAGEYRLEVAHAAGGMRASLAVTVEAGKTSELVVHLRSDSEKP